MAALMEEAPVDLRVNALKASRRHVMAQLAARGIGAAPVPFAPHGLRLDSRANLRQTPLLREGFVEPQDEEHLDEADPEEDRGGDPDLRTREPNRRVHPAGGPAGDPSPTSVNFPWIRRSRATRSNAPGESSPS